ncbi:MAG: hypothetical protein ACLSA6_06020 [Holdemania massiliensis]
MKNSVKPGRISVRARSWIMLSSMAAIVPLKSWSGPMIPIYVKRRDRI